MKIGIETFDGYEWTKIILDTETRESKRKMLILMEDSIFRFTNPKEEIEAFWDNVFSEWVEQFDDDICELLDVSDSEDVNTNEVLIFNNYVLYKGTEYSPRSKNKLKKIKKALGE
jgi:hypothetical protein